MGKQRLVSGIQPTGQMHLGNYLGAVQNWVALQDEFDAFFMIVDLHALTTVYEDPSALRRRKYELALDLLGAGVDPEKACLFYQSDVRQHSELHLVLSMITPLPWLERVPTYKDKMADIKEKDLHTYGFLGYPVLQAADILLYKGEVVPVGKDQLPHLELAREIVRRFNHLYKTALPEADEKLTKFPVLPGLDGKKMSKSYGNTLPISDSAEDLEKKVLRMVTDPGRVRLTDPGNPEVCPVFAYHKLFSSEDQVSSIDASCRTAAIGCVDCKRQCAASVNHLLSEFRERRARYEGQEALVEEILKKGALRAQEVAEETLSEVRSAIGL
jgi:tryptophanyl-tRNA synthetase